MPLIKYYRLARVLLDYLPREGDQLDRLQELYHEDEDYYVIVKSTINIPSRIAQLLQYLLRLPNHKPFIEIRPHPRILDIISNRIEQHPIPIPNHLKHTHIQLHLLEFLTLLINVLQYLQLIHNRVATRQRNVLDIDKHLGKWDVSLATQF